MIDAGLPPYVCRCGDRSRLVDPSRKQRVPLFDRRLPGWPPANLVTVGASAGLWTVCGLEVAAGTVPPARFAVFLVSSLLIAVLLAAGALGVLLPTRSLWRWSNP